MSNGLPDSDNTNWFGRLVSTLESSFPGISLPEYSSSVERSEPDTSELSETEYEVDLNTLEITQILKRKKNIEVENRNQEVSSSIALVDYFFKQK